MRVERKDMAREACEKARMTLELLLGLFGFAFVTSVTPGPNNLMLLASGVNFGLRRTVPHMLGISLGHAFMVLAVGLGLMGLMEAWPASRTLLKVAAVLYMLWLAWKIATAAPPPNDRAPDAADETERGRPFTFLQAAAFQWVNPKAWVMALGALAAYAPERTLAAVALVAILFAAVNLPSVGLWAWAGEKLRIWLTEPSRLRLFNVTMALLLVASLVPIVME